MRAHLPSCDITTQHLKRDDVVWIRRRLLKWSKSNYADFPWRHTRNKWHALSAEIMLQRTRAEQVVPVYLNFIQKYPSASVFLADNSVKLFKSLGLFWRDNQFKRLAEKLIHGHIPEDRQELKELPAVGSYVAAAFRSLHLNLRDTIIDSNVVRLYGRFFGFNTHGETRRAKWFIELAENVTPNKQFRSFNYALIDFTRAICRSKPECNSCLLNKRCKFFLRRQNGKNS